jgi:iron complex transport system ATP-binding protein
VPGRTILDRVSVDVPDGLVTGLIGPNGSGKTTLLHLMAGLRRPDAGQVRIGEADVHRLQGRERARGIALLEQNSDTELQLTVREIVELGRTPHLRRWPGRFTARDHRAVTAALLTARAESLVGREWSTLSGGERQRVQLARALAQEPSVLLLDEPTNHLDLGHQLEFFQTVRRLGVTVLAALHDLELAAAYCDRLVVLDGGRVVADGTPAEVLTRALLAEVYGVDASVRDHPTRHRQHVVWNGPLDRRTGGPR